MGSKELSKERSIVVQSLSIQMDFIPFGHTGINSLSQLKSLLGS
jgi:hypothetical protein